MELLSLFLQVFCLQVAVISFIAAILLLLLEIQLVELAVHDFEAINPNAFPAGVTEILITVPYFLNRKIQTRISDAFLKKTSRLPTLVIQTEKQIMGGIIIAFHNKTIDNSLKNRLKEGGIIA